MSIFSWFKAQYRCKLCFNYVYEEDKDTHLCKDNRKLWGTRIIKKGKNYIVQGEYLFSPHYMLPPEPYWDTLLTTKSLSKAKEKQQKILEDNNMFVVG